jgi:hypothetical protein
MAAPLSAETEPEHPPARLPRSRFLGCAALLGGLFVLDILILVGIWFYGWWKAEVELAVQVARVRARREPLTTVELNDFYQPAKNRPDVTQEIVDALAACEAPELKAAAADLPLVGKATEIPLPPNPWPQLEEAEAYLARLTSARDTFRDVAQREGTVRFPVDFSPGPKALLPQAQAMRHGARILSLQFHVHLHRGRTSDAAECILDQIAMARVLEQEPNLISQLVHLALIAVAVNDLQNAVGSADVANADLQRLQKGLRSLEFQRCLVRALAGERATCYTICIDPSRMGGEGAAVTPAEAREIAQRPPTYVRDAATMLDHNLRIAEAAEQSLFAALHESEQVEAEIFRLRRKPLGTLWNMMTLLSSPAYRTAAIAVARGAARRDAADVAIAAELYRSKHGIWPERLEQLVPEYLPAVPVDSFNNQPQKMVSTAEEFIAYSVGKEGQDDRGNLSNRDDPQTDTGFAIRVRTGE